MKPRRGSRRCYHLPWSGCTALLGPDSACDAWLIFCMPCSHYIDPRKGVIFATSIGTVTDFDWISALMSIARDKDFRPDLRGFADYTGVTDSMISAETIALLAANPASAPSSRWAFLVGPGLAGATIGFYKSCLRHGQLEIFTDRSEALAWLNEGVSAEKRVE